MPPLTYKAPLVSFKAFLTLSLLLFALTGATLAQEATSTAAAARTRYLSEMGMIPPSRDVAVDEFVNYHRHQIGTPKAGEAVAMDVRWGNDRLSRIGREAILQVGFSTAFANDRQQLRPLNLALVIDKSGSMGDLDKMSRVKVALLTLVSQLRERDTLSIVVFDNEAQVLFPACSPTDREGVKRLIRGIEPGGSTNIHSGLMLGYHEALKYYRKDATNRVILLTDGIANRGVTEPWRISQDSLRFNDRGIDLSTIGVGLDLNEDLLRQLAKSGRGLFHFVSDTQDIEKVFVKEVQSLVSPVATEPNLEIDYDSGLELLQVYGYEPQLRNNGVSIKLDNMNNGLTQVVLLRFTLARRVPFVSRMPVKVRLTYYDLAQKRIVTAKESCLTLNDGPADMLEDYEVSKNFTVALLAQAIRDMAVASEARRYKEAENFVTTAIARTVERYPHLEDEDIKRTLQIAQRYQDTLRRYNQQEDSRDDR